MGARLNNSLRQTNRGHVDAFPGLHMRSIRKTLFHEGQRTEGFFGVSNAFTNSVDRRFEHDLKAILSVECDGS